MEKATPEMDSRVERVGAGYDAVPYESHPFPQSAPGHLAAVAYLFGLEAPALTRARVLEIGCSAGGNLIPFAAWHPQARVVGVDLSQVHIENARRRVRELGLDNVELRRADIASMDVATLGEFDYVICHGVYSWVPEEVQAAILTAFQTVLAPRGIGYLSYNVYPGWKAKEIVRDAMLLRGGDVGPAEHRLGYARGMIDFLEHIAPADSVLAKAISEFRVQTADTRDYYVLHEYLEAFNAPCYFLKLVERLGRHGLAYLAEAMPSTMFAVNYGSEISEPLLKECGHSQVLVEQYLDFFVNRAFRQSLVTRAENADEIRYQLDRKRLGRFNFAASLPPAGQATCLDDSSQSYGEDGGTVVTQEPVIKAALQSLNARWPWTISYGMLQKQVRERLVDAGVDVPATLSERVDDLLEHLIMTGKARFRLEEIRCDGVSTPIRLDDSVRRFAGLTQDEPDARTFNIWHELIPLSAVDRQLLPLLDGTRDRDALIEAVLELVRRDVLRYERDGEPLTDTAQLRTVGGDFIDTVPQLLLQMKLGAHGVSQTPTE
jgi:methyltransferase-like protein/SAM-dependent methyltransferase